MNTTNDPSPLDLKALMAQLTATPTTPASPPTLRSTTSDCPLDAVDRFLARFVAFPSDADRHTVTLWVAHSHLIECFDSTPRLVLTSPEKQSGKSRCLEVIGLLAANARHTASISPAALFRLIDKGPQPTMLIDEYDTIWGRRAPDSAEDLRALLNSGHRRGAFTYRCIPPAQDVKAFATYAAVALAGIGNLPDTITDRSVIIRMRRRSRTETVEPFRFREHEPAGHTLGDQLASWANDHRHLAYDHIPDNPLQDRPADVWEPLLTIGELHGNGWAEKAQTAARHHTQQGPGESLGMELLQDIRTVWPPGTTTLTTTDLIALLTEDTERRWGDYRGKPLTARGLAVLLRPFEIRSRHTRNARIYDIGDFHDTWNRYLPPTPEMATQTSQPSP